MDFIFISGQKGVIQRSGNLLEVNVVDDCSIFTKIPGTPKYWQKVRNDLLASINVLGPFQIFFTLSCAEMKWVEVIGTILKAQGYYSIEYVNYGTVEASLLVDGMELDEFLKKIGESKSKLVAENIFLVTRMFNHRMKSFIKNVMLDRTSEDSMHITEYVYRIEFQARGMPHEHGAAWIDI